MILLAIKCKYKLKSELATQARNTLTTQITSQMNRKSFIHDQQLTLPNSSSVYSAQHSICQIMNNDSEVLVPHINSETACV